ncbi:MAG: hypothetical protein IPH07_23730 [Deltaproteobacteria bacterium]|nr:hypothetical protein [Deltaproteobacteria bacterium]
MRVTLATMTGLEIVVSILTAVGGLVDLVLLCLALWWGHRMLRAVESAARAARDTYTSVEQIRHAVRAITS